MRIFDTPLVSRAVRPCIPERRVRLLSQNAEWVGRSPASIDSDALVGDGHIDSPGQSLGGSELHRRSAENLGVAIVAVVGSNLPGSLSQIDEVWRSWPDVLVRLVPIPASHGEDNLRRTCLNSHIGQRVEVLRRSGEVDLA